MADPNEYTIGWICALSEEYVAAQCFLDNKHSRPHEVSPNDYNDYTLGEIAGHYVVIAVLPKGEYGTASAATVATHMLHSFPNVRFGLMVGIGGGAPSSRHDIRLGDIVVSAPTAGQGGVFQYDFGKTIQGQSFQSTQFLDQPPMILLTAVSGLKAQYEIDGHQIEESINSIFEEKPRLRKRYQRPESKTDCLYKSHVLHAPDNTSNCINCGDDDSHVVSRPQRSAEEDNPAIHYGLIASANQLMKDALIRDKLAAEMDVLCFEMESAGLMHHFPCLVVRGICDYADSHKNKVWQGYAAMTAAAYTKDLLQRIIPSRVKAESKIIDLLKPIQEQIQDISKHTSRIVLSQNEQMSREMTKEQQECHRAFKTSTYEQFKNINPERLDGTCRWVVENPQYLDWWNNNHNDLLWISADPGCGKSVLAKSLIEIDFRRSDDRLAVCYFFFKDNDEQNSFTTALCAMLHQLFKVNPELIRHALPSWRENGIKLQYEVDELWRIFMDATSDPACCNTVCIFDGLDECQSNDRDKLISRLEKFYIETHLFNRGNWLKFLVTSRPYDEIRFALEPVTRSFPWIHLNGDQESEHMHEEISLVVKIRVAELAENLSEMLSVETRERLEKELLQMEHRTYLWLHLAMDNIRTTFQQSIRPDEESIQMVPKSVNAAYEKILNRAATNKESEVRTILQIIVGARRPLLIEEMAMALGLATFDTSLAIGGIGLNPKGLEDKIRQLCGLFVSIYDHRIFLIHQTATEFLVKRTDTEYSNSKWCFEQSDIESLMSTVCIKFLLMTDLDRSFWSYATAHWPYHVRQTSSRADMELLENLDQLYNQFYDASTGGYAAWFENLWREEGVHLDRPNLRPLHLAALIGHDLWIRKWKNLSRTSMK